ncbi:hypothetical protein GALL_08540 [mine drainage metagenome]|uniref:Uncharacterized protein n=1 Tax=mine drainage metagenome TaxID=410659 RepID=A0A1J5TUN8_9ZZZZ
MTTTNHKTREEAQDALRFLQGFMPQAQIAAIAAGMHGEEQQHFFNKVVEIERLIRTMPKTYEQDGAGEEAIAHLHYFLNGFDWFITERDIEREQLQAFGLACLGEEEMGYINIVELIRNGAELDLYFEPRSLRKIFAERG